MLSVRRERLDTAALLAGGVTALGVAALVVAYWTSPFELDFHLSRSARRVVMPLVLLAAALTPLLSAAGGRPAYRRSAGRARHDRRVGDDRPVHAEHPPAVVHHRADRTGARGVEEAARIRPHVLGGARLPAGSELLAGVPADGRVVDQPAELLEAVDEHGGVALVGEEAVVDGERRPRIRAVQAHAAAGARLHREDRAADLVAVLGGLDGREAEQVPGTLRARPAPHAQRHLRHCQWPSVVLEAPGLLEQAVGWRPGSAYADVVEQALADRQPALRPDAAAEQDARRAVRARAHDDRVGPELSRRGVAPTARSPSRSTRSTSVSARIVRFARSRAPSR